MARIPQPVDDRSDVTTNPDIAASSTKPTAAPRIGSRTRSKQSSTPTNTARAADRHATDDPQTASASGRPPEPVVAPSTIAKPSSFSLDKFRTKTAANIGGVATLLTALPHHSIAQAKDFVRLHPEEQAYWSPELCFLSVPIKGAKRDTLHLIEEELAMRYLPAARVLRFRLALATKPYDIFFLCHVPTRNVDNLWNSSNIQACEQARTLWVQATSRKEEGVDEYKIDFSRDADAFPPPQWPSQSLAELIEVTFTGRMVMTEDHPALLRLIGAKPQVS
jgi:hypothetical protein